MLFRLVVFDLDGTLVNSLPDIAGSCNSVLGRFGYAVHPLDDYQSFVGWGLERTLRFCVPDSIKESLFQTMYKEVLEIYQACSYRHTQPYRGIIPLVETLKTRKIAMLVYTSKHEGIARDIISNLFPSGSFRKVIGCVSSRPQKPDAGILLEYMLDNGFRNTECLMVGDSHVDMHTARNAGMHFAAVLWGFGTFPEEWNPGYSFDNPGELGQWITRGGV